MPLVKLPFTPGVNKEVTSYSATGMFFNADKIRFRSGFVEKMGGWKNAYPGATFNGVARTLLTWVTYDGYTLTAIGTNQKYYVQYGAVYNDITPLRTGTPALASNPFTTNGTNSLITVNAPGHGASPGSYVTFSGATAVGGYTVTGQYEIISTPDGNTFTINAYPTVPTAATGGGTPTAVYDINAGGSTVTASTGWGAGGWSLGGWGLGTSATVNIPLQLWSQCNFNQDLVFSPTSGQIYYWPWATGGGSLTTPAVTLGAYAATQVKGTANVTAVTTAGTSITVDNSFYITSGATVTVITNTSGTASVPAGTYVTTAYTNGFVVTLSNNVTVGVGDVLGFSYAGYSVPNQTNKIFGSSTLQFTIALGANPYDPTNFNTAFNPMLVRWSDQSNAYEWVPQTQNQSGETPLSNGSYLITAVNNRQEILVWSNTTLYSMQYVGPPLIFSFTILQDNVSIISPNAAVTINNITYWMGLDRFYIYTGSVQTLPCSLKRYVYSNLNYNQLNQIVCGFNEGFNEIWWHYPSKNSTVNDSYVIFNYLDNCWYDGTMNRTAWLDSQYQQYPQAVFSLQQSYLSQALTTSSTSIQVLNAFAYPTSGTITIDSELIAYTSNSNNTLLGLTRGLNGTTVAAHSIYAPVVYGIPNQIVFHENGLDDGTPATALPIYSYIESADITPGGDGDKFVYMWRIVPDVTFTNSTASSPVLYMTVEPRQNSGSAYTASVGGNATDVMSVVNTALPTAPTYTYPVEQYTGQVYTRVRGRQFAFKAYSQDMGVMWQMGANRFDVRPDGKR